MASLPVILCGKDPAMVVPAAKRYLPEVDVVHICHTVEQAKKEIPSLLKGDFVTAGSKLGSNLDRPAEEQRVPLAVITGGAFTPEEFESLRKEDVQSVPWLKIEISNVPVNERPPNPNYPALVVAKVKECLREHGLLDDPITTSHEGAIWEC